MRNFLGLIWACLFSFEVFGCSEVLSIYEYECKAQNQFNQIYLEYKALESKTGKSINCPMPKGLDLKFYLNRYGRLLNLELNDYFLEIDDVITVHKALFAEKSFLSLSDVGVLRTDYGITNPKINLSCDTKILDLKTLNLLQNFDLRSIEGYSLLKLENIHTCEDENFQSADLYFYKGASVRIELSRWITDLNDMLFRYEAGIAPLELSPYAYLIQMKRWFVSISPFAFGNEQVANELINHSFKRLGLAPLPFIDLQFAFFKDSSAYQQSTLQTFQDSLDFYQKCLSEIN